MSRQVPQEGGAEEAKQKAQSHGGGHPQGGCVREEEGELGSIKERDRKSPKGTLKFDISLISSFCLFIWTFPLQNP